MADAREPSTSGRLVVELTNRALAALINRVAKDEASRTQVTCTALRMYDLMKEAADDGGDIVIRRADGTETKIVLL